MARDDKFHLFAVNCCMNVCNVSVQILYVMFTDQSNACGSESSVHKLKSAQVGHHRSIHRWLR